MSWHLAIKKTMNYFYYYERQQTIYFKNIIRAEKKFR